MVETDPVTSDISLERENDIRTLSTNLITPKEDANGLSIGRDVSLPSSQTIVYRENGVRNNRTALHASDRRSYIERENELQKIERPQSTTNLLHHINGDINYLTGKNAKNINIITNNQNNINNNAVIKELSKSTFNISVKALGGEKGNQNNRNASLEPLCPKSEKLVSQLLKDGKHRICCECKQEVPQ